MKKLPIAKSVFKEIIEENCCYVDKTQYVKMLEDFPSKYLFISRPRRFGKTLFLDTIRAAYTAEKELFNGLSLEKNWDWTKKYPIISLDWGCGTVTNKEELEESFAATLRFNARRYQIKLEEKLPARQFEELIVTLYEKYGEVVILVDEYDKPIVDNLGKKQADVMRETLGGFYSVLKSSDQYLKLVFLTGVSKFAKTSIFSKLNNIKDLTYDAAYSDLFGYTQKEFEDVFAEYLTDVDLEKVKEWYDGYKFLGSEMYNPYDILLFLYDKRYRFYWFETGTPTLLVNELKRDKKKIPDFNNIFVSETDLQSFDIHNMKFEVLLLQTGYLTIDEEFTKGSKINYRLKLPNLEVRTALNDFLLSNLFYPDTNQDKNVFSNQLYDLFFEQKPEQLKPLFESFFESIPHQWYKKNDIAKYEGYYHCLFYTAFSSLGFETIPEDSTRGGDIDLTVITEDAIYIFEFKMEYSKMTAMEQIKERGYYKKYLNSGKNIYLIGIEFDKEKRNISDFELEKREIN
ncbi:MAG: ATP-binding protein [Verrucomicrobiota bacterium]|nr:ATP-binding protein [Verrucomicrobiota bacterium]